MRGASAPPHEAPAYLRSTVLNGARSALRHGKVVDRHAPATCGWWTAVGGRRRRSPRTSTGGSSPPCARSRPASGRRWP